MQMERVFKKALCPKAQCDVLPLYTVYTSPHMIASTFTSFATLYVVVGFSSTRQSVQYPIDRKNV